VSSHQHPIGPNGGDVRISEGATHAWERRWWCTRRWSSRRWHRPHRWTSGPARCGRRRACGGRGCAGWRRRQMPSPQRQRGDRPSWLGAGQKGVLWWSRWLERSVGARKRGLWCCRRRTGEATGEGGERVPAEGVKR
jgi:hypothetical protein